MRDQKSNRLCNLRFVRIITISFCIHMTCHQLTLLIIHNHPFIHVQIRVKASSDTFYFCNRANLFLGRFRFNNKLMRSVKRFLCRNSVEKRTFLINKEMRKKHLHIRKKREREINRIINFSHPLTTRIKMGSDLKILILLFYKRFGSFKSLNNIFLQNVYELISNCARRLNSLVFLNFF